MGSRDDEHVDDVLRPPRGCEAEVLSEGLVLLSFPLFPPELPGGLTAAEREIASAVYAGQTNAEIAGSRGVSHKTVGHQLEVIYRKLGVTSRVELVRLLLPRVPAESER